MCLWHRSCDSCLHSCNTYWAERERAHTLMMSTARVYVHTPIHTSARLCMLNCHMGTMGSDWVTVWCGYSAVISLVPEWLLAASMQLNSTCIILTFQLQILSGSSQSYWYPSILYRRSVMFVPFRISRGPTVDNCRVWYLLGVAYTLPPPLAT